MDKYWQNKLRYPLDSAIHPLNNWGPLRCLHYFLAAILVYHGWRFHIGFCKFLRNISTNISGLSKHSGLQLGEVSNLVIFRITSQLVSFFHWMVSDFLLRDSENDLYFLPVNYQFWKLLSVVKKLGPKKIDFAQPLLQKRFDTRLYLLRTY